MTYIIIIYLWKNYELPNIKVELKSIYTFLEQRQDEDVQVKRRSTVGICLTNGENMHEKYRCTILSHRFNKLNMIH